MGHLRRSFAFTLFSVIAMLAGYLLVGGLDAQPIPPVKGKGGTEVNSANLSSIRINEDPRIRQIINIGRDALADKEWNIGITALQAVLDDKKDSFVQVSDVDPTGRTTTQRWTSAKFEANNLLGSMSLEGLQAYELAKGADAKTLLDDAKKTGDRETLADVANRYCHTLSGIEANEILATLYLARGQVFTAALTFEKLLQMNPERTKLSDLTLFKAALAFHRANDKARSDELWTKLETNLKGQPGLKVGEDVIPLAKLRKVLDETGIVNIVHVHDWESWRGSRHNSAQASGSPPLLDTKLWERKIHNDKIPGLAADNDQAAEVRVQAAMKQTGDANHAVMPGFFPVVSQGIMVYRSQRDIRAVSLKDQKIKYEDSLEEYKAGEIVWKSMDLNRSLSVLLDRNATRAKCEQWLDNYNQVPGFNSLLFDNTVIGTLVTDHRNIYAINDLAVPPHPQCFTQFAFNNPQFNPGDVKPLMTQNQLLAFDLFSGKLKWELNAEGDQRTPEDPDFKNSHFLSLPLSVGGKLYVLNEKLSSIEGGGVNPFGGMQNPYPGDSELRLVCIDPTKVEKGRPAIVGEIQPLGTVSQSNRYLQDIGRRTNAVQLAFGDGILVCPTNAGEVFGIDVTTRSLVWSYPYRENSHQQIMLPGMPFQPQPFPGPRNSGTTVISKWKSSPPAISDGKIVFTAPDADSVHCISLRDGKPLWRKGQQKGDLFLAGVYKGNVLIVSENTIRAHDLKTGSLRWAAPTGNLPSGQGIASKDIYYLPLKNGEIIAVDVVTGQIKAHNRGGATSPGNLVFYEGMVLSQTVNEIVAYPQLSIRLTSAKDLSAKAPENMTLLTDYGELLLKDGQVQPAVDALMKVYNSKPDGNLAKRVRDRLFEALTDLMQIDFNKTAADHLTVYKELCNVPDDNLEEQRRKAKFYRLVGAGREEQGNLVEAFQMYKDFGALPMYQKTGIPSSEDPNQLIPINVWLRGRISAMLAKAKPNERAPLETKIADEWKAVAEKNDLDAIRSFVGMFDIPVPVGRQARVRLAETIMERNDRSAFLEAELSLHQVMGSEYKNDPLTGGRAVAALARLEELKGTIDSMRLAAAYYRQLGRDFPDTKVRGDKTGANLLDQLATDKRFLPFLAESAGGSWGPGKLAARDLPPGSFQVGITGFVMLPFGDQSPFARQYRLMLDPSDTMNPRIRLQDNTTNQDRWITNLGHVPMNQQLFFHMYQQTNNQAYHPNARFRFYHVKGHVLVCQVGVMVYGIDGDTGKKLWEVQTVENVVNNGFINLQQVLNDREGNPEFHYWDQRTNQRFTVTLGRIGSAQASYVAVLGHKGLTVVDPLRGTVMWRRSDVSVNSHVFGDDQYLFLAEANATGAFGVGRALRASDGEPVPAAKDFSNLYQGRIHVFGRQILAATADRQNLVVRLYDIVTSKDVWVKPFAAGSQILRTEDRNIAGVLEPNGNLTVLDAESGRIILSSSILHGRINPTDLKGLSDPLLLQDNERFYVALNRPLEIGRVANGLLHNNFNNGTRCLPVNGWVLAIHREDGKRNAGDREITWKKGDFAWHTYVPVSNQMIVMEQFSNLPILLFTTRYIEIQPNGNQRWVSVTQSFSKSSGKMVWEHRPPNVNGVAPFFTQLRIDQKARTINLIGFGGSVQHYVDEGKGAPPVPGAMLPPGVRGIEDGASNTIVIGDGVVRQPLRVANPELRVVRPPIVVERDVLPAPVLPPAKRE